MKLFHCATIAILIGMPLGMLGYGLRFGESTADSAATGTDDNAFLTAEAKEDHRIAIDAFAELVATADAENWPLEKRDAVFEPLSAGYRERGARDGWPAAGAWLRGQLASKP